jgi:Flp pilus assembly protein TadG
MRRRDRPRGRARTESGASALELSFLAPGLIFLIFLVIQAGLFFYGRTVAIQAAREGVSQLRLAQTEDQYAQIEADVERNTENYATSVGREALLAPQAVAEPHYGRDDAFVTVEVSGQVITLVPGLELTATARAQGRVERFAPDEVGP